MRLLSKGCRKVGEKNLSALRVGLSLFGES